MRAEFAACNELVVGAATKGFCRVVAAQQPHDVRAWRLLRECGEVGERADRGVTGAENGDRLAGEAHTIRAEDVGHSVRNLRPCLAFAEGRQTVRARGIGRPPRA